MGHIPNSDSPFSRPKNWAWQQKGQPPGPDHAFESGESSLAYIERAAINTNQLDNFFAETAITVLRGWLVIQVLAVSPQRV